MVRHDERVEPGGGETMRLTPDIERTLRRYVLGDLEEGLRSELEELLITDPDAFEALGVVEDELIEEYLEKTGSQAERRSFEQHFLSGPQGMRRLRFVRALKNRASTPSLRLQAETRPAAGRLVWPGGWRRHSVGLAAALAVSLMGNVWLAWHYRDDQQEPSPVPPATEARSTVPTVPAVPAVSTIPSFSPAAATPSPLGTPAPFGAPPARNSLERLHGAAASVATFALSAGLLRGEGSLPRVSVPAAALVVRLRLELPEDDYSRYRAAVMDVDGDEIWVASKLRAEQGPGHPSVLVLLPATLLTRGDYQVRLSGVGERGEPEVVGTYAFRVSTP
jgi:hypothetical protein